jgi:phosphatidylserine/phosphatidylglycerophosphate/cardiolipin synthase-like enzyme
MNYHRLLLGTFHPKFMVVDRKLAIIQSNNIQDNDNLEMMTHIEGPIVDSFYDLALISWDKQLEPPLPCATQPAFQKEPPCFSDQEFNDLVSLQKELKDVANWSKGNPKLPDHVLEDPHFDNTMAGEIRRMQSAWSPSETENRREVYAKQLSKYSCTFCVNWTDNTKI